VSFVCSTVLLNQQPRPASTVTMFTAGRPELGTLQRTGLRLYVMLTELQTCQGWANVENTCIGVLLIPD